MAFGKGKLLLSASRESQLTAALATSAVADPLQAICDEAEAEVERLCTGYVIAELSLAGFVRSVALQRIYAKAGPVPPDVQKDYDGAMKELEAIASGKRPNLPRTTATNPASGKWGSETKVVGRLG